MNNKALIFEILVIFVLLPILILSVSLPKEGIMLILWSASAYAYVQLRNTDITIFSFDFQREDLFFVLKRFALISIAMTAFVLLYEPDSFLSLLKARPFFWFAVMLLYPLLSAYVQELLFRSFFFHRYKQLFNGHTFSFVLTNALLFAYMHIIFENWVAVLFTFFGGFLFAQTYLKTRSTLLTAIEHSLYGNTIYTLGLGHYFFHSATL